MENMKIIKKFIADREENDVVDFKLKFYSKEKKFDMIKDILSFANNCNNQNKYIIFGYDNVSDVFNNVDYNSVDDISNYNQLINEYCEPFIDISIEKFEYNGYNLASLKIKKCNSNRPYMMKKDYKINGAFLLRKGELYVRKNANNFICSREDLDMIYDSRRQVIISISNNEFYKIKIRKGNETRFYYSLLISLVNSTKINIAIISAELTIKFERNSFIITVLYIEEFSKEYKKELKNIKMNSFYISNETQIRKALIFDISEKTVEIIENRLSLGEKPIVTIMLTDVEGKEYKTNFDLRSINFD